MNKRLLWGLGAALAIGLAAGVLFSPDEAENYARRADVREFAARMEAEHDFDTAALLKTFAAVRRRQSVLDAMARPAEKTRIWAEYKGMFLQNARIADGAAFWEAHRGSLQRAADIFGVPPEIIVAIIGVESHYGRNTGKYRALDALTTLAFDYPPRAAFFREQLRECLLLAREMGVDPLAFKSSYAGAMGYGQFIPGSYRKYAVDFNRDGTKNLLDDPQDAIGSIGNYLLRHDWRRGEAVLAPARVAEGFDGELVNRSLKPELSLAQLRARGFFATPPAPPADQRAAVLVFQGRNGPEYWLGLHNFYVLTRYNPSRLYAMAVHQLGREIRARVAPAAGVGGGAADVGAFPGTSP